MNHQRKPAVSGMRRMQPGMAPLELVMSIPIVLAIMAMLFSVGYTLLGRSTAAIEARHLVWQRRADPQKIIPKLQEAKFTATNALNMFDAAKEMRGEVSGQCERTVRIFPRLGPKVKTFSKASVLTRSWDYQEVQFKKTPDVTILGKMGGVDTGSFERLSSLLNFF
jgi:hypothetical protein